MSSLCVNDSKVFIKSFQGVDVPCLVLDEAVAWFGADEIFTILDHKQHLKHLPFTQKARWRDLEPQVRSDKWFVSALGVRLLIAKQQQDGSGGPEFYNNTPLDRNRQSHIEVSETAHVLGNSFINEALFDARAYHLLESVALKLQQIYNYVVVQPPVLVV